MLKADLHTHSSEDPVDLLPYDAKELVDRAAALGYTALAVTLHDRQLDLAALAPYARERGIVVVPGIERTIRGKHVLLLNFPAAQAESVADFDELRRLKAKTAGLVIAPHPFFPHPTSLGRHALDAYPDLFDAVELNAFYTRQLDFNRRGLRWAQNRGKPVVGNADVHRLHQLGRTFSLIESDPDPAAVCEAIRRQRVAVRTEPLTTPQVAAHLLDLLSVDALNTWRRMSLRQAGQTPAPVPQRRSAPTKVTAR
jgi:predicted metal-dependent phosphoesterase TrpH